MFMRSYAAGLIASLSLAGFVVPAWADETHESDTPMHERAAQPGASAASTTHTAQPSARGGGERDDAATRSGIGAPFVADIAQLARSNQNFRRVVHTGMRSQLVLMSIPAGGDIGAESHSRVEQLLVIVSGRGEAVVNGAHTPLGPGSIVVAPPGSMHNVIANGSEPLRLYTVYSPPNHIDGRVHATKADAEADRADEAFGHRVR